MAYLKPKKIHGHTYWYIVESRRVGGRVKTVNLAYLGRADEILRGLGQADRAAERLKSFRHGGVAVPLSLADRPRRLAGAFALQGLGLSPAGAVRHVRGAWRHVGEACGRLEVRQRRSVSEEA